MTQTPRSDAGLPRGVLGVRLSACESSWNASDRSQYMHDPTLQDYMAVLRRRRLVLIASVLVALVIALALSLLLTPQYRAEAELLLRRTPSEEILVDAIGQARSSADAER